MADQQAPQPSRLPADKTPAADVESGKVWAILSYLCIICLVIVLVQKKNKFAMYHAWQALSCLIPCIGIVFWIMGLINAISGKYAPVPLVGNWLEDQFAKS